MVIEPRDEVFPGRHYQPIGEIGKLGKIKKCNYRKVMQHLILCDFFSDLKTKKPADGESAGLYEIMQRGKDYR